MPNTEESWGDVQEHVEFPGADYGGSHTEVTHVGWFQRIMGSFVSALFGIAVFLGAFVLLYWNEGRPDLSQVAKTAIEVDANRPGTKAIGKLAAVSGTLASTERVGDAYFAPGPFLAVKREAEMYAWIEESHTETQKNAGGSETKTTTYTYHKSWTGSPSRSFRKAGYRNPAMSVSDATTKAKRAKVGVMAVDMATLELPAYKPVSLSARNTRNGQPKGPYLYLGDRSGSPAIGDIRLSYAVVPSGQKVTLLGKPDSASHIAPYKHRTGDTFYRAFPGSKKDAVATMHGEHVMMTWLLRLAGFGMMWGGLFLMLEPINVLLDVLPFLGSMGRGLSGFGTFLIALVLSVVTILVAMLLHNLVAMIAIGLATVAIGSVVFSKKKEQLTRQVRRA
jgi:hypothetical protein